MASAATEVTMSGPSDAAPVGRRAECLGIVGATGGNRHDGGTYVHASFGRVVGLLAQRYERVLLSIPIEPAPPPPSRDFRLEAANVELVAQPAWMSSLAALQRPIAVMRSFARLCRECDRIFIRGLQPWLQYLYVRRLLGGPPLAHWLVGDPVAEVIASAHGHAVMRAAIVAYCGLEQLTVPWAARITRTALIANGQNLFRKYRTPNTHLIVSSSIQANEIHVREDTCGGATVRLIFVGFIRPGKGLPYLIEALSQIRTQRRVELAIVGPAEKYSAELERVERAIDAKGLRDRVSFEGYVAYGPALFEQMRRSDVLVLPTLSEGTPRVLIEARAQGLPVVSTNVGGIPSSVTHEHDGLLVPPADPQALAAAIERVIEDGALRRRLISNGLARTREMTVEAFVQRVDEIMQAQR